MSKEPEIILVFSEDNLRVSYPDDVDGNRAMGPMHVVAAGIISCMNDPELQQMFYERGLSDLRKVEEQRKEA